MTVRTAIIFRHVAFEDVGVLGPLLEERGYTLCYLEMGVDAPAPAAEDADLLVVLGGPIGVYETDTYPFLTAEIEAIRARVEARRPTLGICLGAQLIAAALGAHVGIGPAKEIGWGVVTLTQAGLASPLAKLNGLEVLHWHGDVHDVPRGGETLAHTPNCPVQAFRIGNEILGLQFHLEADPAQIERWLIGHAAELAQARIDPRLIREATARHGAAMARAGTAVIAEWLHRNGIG